MSLNTNGQMRCRLGAPYANLSERFRTYSLGNIEIYYRKRERELHALIRHVHLSKPGETIAKHLENIPGGWSCSRNLKIPGRTTERETRLTTALTWLLASVKDEDRWFTLAIQIRMVNDGQ